MNAVLCGHLKNPPPDYAQIVTNGPYSKQQEKDLLIGIPIYEGSKAVWCSKCDREFWLGPKQLEFLRTNPLTVRSCMLCTIRDIKKEGRKDSCVAHFGTPERDY